MDSSNKERLVMLAYGITIDHGLDMDDLLSLADYFLDGTIKGTAYPAGAFNDLVVHMSDIKEQIPEWLGTTKVLPFSDYQFEVVSLLIEARFWHGLLTKRLSSFWHWRVVFGSAWHAHRQAVSQERITGFVQTMEKSARKLLPWVDIISRRYEEDFDVGYEVLRRAYFPAGIEDAREGFRKHYKQTKMACLHLENRCQMAKKYTIANSSLVKACEDLLRETKELLRPVYQIAKIWGKITRAQQEWWQLPGNSCGLTYGRMARVDLSDNTYELSLREADGKCPWRNYCELQFPIRMEKGSSWRNFLCNQRQPDWTTIRRYSVDGSTDKRNEQEGSLEIILPQSLYPIWLKYQLQYSEAESELTKSKGDQNITTIGDDYWKRRSMKIRSTHVDYQVHTERLMEGRPRFDGAQSLRFDYMNAALKDLRLKRYVKDNRSAQTCMVLEGVVEY
ncbi:uncharacterized protein PG986_010857 [Apiospora aurea]|uniref:Uncharacterized protein n=1 Tax=Apiospora aurea TaxID=335848 RepID=A0ABR1Q3F1_9PEZI